MRLIEHRLELGCHPSMPSEAVRAIEVRVRRSAIELQMSFYLAGDISRIRIPAPAVPRFSTELWQHTCFEAFVAVDGNAAYHEFNFAPSGEWAVYRFSRYRSRGPLLDEAMRPQIAAHPAADGVELEAFVRLDRLSAAHAQAALRVGVSAVIEEHDRLSYWALRHSLDKPDFHHADGFALLLDPPGCL